MNSPALSPRSRAVLHTLAFIHLEFGDPGRALEYCSLLLRVDPGSRSCWRIRALALLRCGRSEEALAAADRAGSLPGPDSESAAISLMRARILHAMGREAEAEAEAASVQRALRSERP